jgi:hypothetical protein
MRFAIIPTKLSIVPSPWALFDHHQNLKLELHDHCSSYFTSEKGSTTPPLFIFSFLCWHFPWSPFVQSCLYVLSCVRCKSARKSTSTITIAFEGEQDLSTLFLVLLFACLCWWVVLVIVVIAPLVLSCFPHCLLCASYRNVKRNTSTIAITFKDEQDLPTPLWSCCLHICVVTLCLPSL